VPRNKDTWLSQPETTSAIASLDAHYAVLGCAAGGSRLDGLLGEAERFQTKEAAETLRSAFDALAAHGPTEDAIRNVARGTWLTFAEPAQGLAEALDRHGVADDHVGRPGAFGRLWARHACDAAWTIWVASGGYSTGGAGILR
jgi:hypothetical protein